MVDFEKKAPKVRFLEVRDNSEGQRIDNFLIKQLKGVPKSLIYKKIRKGEVRINGSRSRPASKIATGDIIRLPPLVVANNEKIVINTNFQKRMTKTILYEDEKILILNKPAGIAVHGGSGISFGIIESFRSARKDSSYLELAHRLDKDTSGCLILTKKRSVLRELNELQRNKSIDKTYLTLLCGYTEKNKIVVNKPLKKNILKSGERIVKVSSDGKPSLTEFHIITKFKDYLFAKVILRTGRTHQIRVHAQSLGLPIAGDLKYGSSSCNENLKKIGLNRLFLHANKLSFQLGDSKKILNFEANLPIELKDVLGKLK
tara:strand:+ start:383 stop:1330 length:948 start_codon:yes stop_codon:yes gene_type:complete